MQLRGWRTLQPSSCPPQPRSRQTLRGLTCLSTFASNLRMSNNGGLVGLAGCYNKKICERKVPWSKKIKQYLWLDICGQGNAFSAWEYDQHLWLGVVSGFGLRISRMHYNSDVDGATEHMHKLRYAASGIIYNWTVLTRRPRAKKHPNWSVYVKGSLACSIITNKPSFIISLINSWLSNLSLIATSKDAIDYGAHR